MRLSHSDPNGRGYRRVRSGRGFRYLDISGDRLADDAELARIRALAIPPAWRDVWICASASGHIQAVGTDVAGRRQYLYHDVWREQRDAAKFDDVLATARRLPRLRKQVAADLARKGLVRPRVMATAVRLLDLGAFRIGSEEYAVGDDATYGVATLRRDHVTSHRDGRLVFCYPAKGGIERRMELRDEAVAAVIRSLRRRSEYDDQLFAFRVKRVWHPLRSTDINDYLKESTGREITAKDFRTWHATVLAAVSLAGAGTPATVTKRRNAVRDTMQEVAEFLGNTPTVARQSYVDPRVLDEFDSGNTISAALRRCAGEYAQSDPRILSDPKMQTTIERAVIRLIDAS